MNTTAHHFTERENPFSVALNWAIAEGRPRANDSGKVFAMANFPEHTGFNYRLLGGSIGSLVAQQRDRTIEVHAVSTYSCTKVTIASAVDFDNAVGGNCDMFDISEDSLSWNNLWGGGVTAFDQEAVLKSGSTNLAIVLLPFQSAEFPWWEQQCPRDWIIRVIDSLQTDGYVIVITSGAALDQPELDCTEWTVMNFVENHQISSVA